MKSLLLLSTCCTVSVLAAGVCPPCKFGTDCPPSGRKCLTKCSYLSVRSLANDVVGTCKGFEVCIDGLCHTPCDPLCSPGSTCLDGECIYSSCKDDTQCGTGSVCHEKEGECVAAPCSEKEPCPTDLQCIDSKEGNICFRIPCRGTETLNGCPLGSECNGRFCTAVVCSTDTDCPFASTCRDKACHAGALPACKANSDCPFATLCTGKHVCSPLGCGKGCAKGSTCLKNSECRADPCTWDTDCPAGMRCNKNVCDTVVCSVDGKLNGVTCAEGSQCRATICKPKTCRGELECPPYMRCSNTECDWLTCSEGKPDVCPRGWHCDGTRCREGEAPPVEADAPIEEAECSDLTKCPVSMRCEGGACVPRRCRMSLDCPLGAICVKEECTLQPCSDDKLCPMGLVCEGGTCSTVECNEKLWRGGGRRIPKSIPPFCHPGSSCLNHICRGPECKTDSECPLAAECIEGRCTPRKLFDYTCTDDFDFRGPRCGLPAETATCRDLPCPMDMRCIEDELPKGGSLLICEPLCDKVVCGLGFMCQPGIVSDECIGVPCNFNEDCPKLMQCDQRCTHLMTLPGNANLCRSVICSPGETCEVVSDTYPRCGMQGSCDSLTCPGWSSCISYDTISVCEPFCNGDPCPVGQCSAERIPTCKLPDVTAYCKKDSPRCPFGLACSTGICQSTKQDCGHPDDPYCPTGSTCERDDTDPFTGSCKSLACQGAACPEGQHCAGKRCESIQWPSICTKSEGDGECKWFFPKDDCRERKCSEGEQCIRVNGVYTCKQMGSCSARCNSGSECELEEGLPQCYNPCGTVRCIATHTCVNGKCVPLCDTIRCAGGMECVSGECISRCPGCDADICVFKEGNWACRQECDMCRPDQKCVQTNGLFSCQSSSCPRSPCKAGETCVGGTCVLTDKCHTIDCRSGGVCIDGKCVPGPTPCRKPCSGVEVCNIVTLSCEVDPGCPPNTCSRHESCYMGTCYPKGVCHMSDCPAGSACIVALDGTHKCTSLNESCNGSCQIPQQCNEATGNAAGVCITVASSPCSACTEEEQCFESECLPASVCERMTCVIKTEKCFIGPNGAADCSSEWCSGECDLPMECHKVGESFVCKPPTPATRTPAPQTRRVTWGINFPFARCDEFGDTMKGSLRAVIASILGEVTELRHICGSVTVLGASQATVEVATDLEKGWLNLTAVLNQKVSSSSVLRTLGAVEKAGPTGVSQCALDGAADTWRDSHGACHAVACHTHFSLGQVANLFVCTASNTTAPDTSTRVVEDDSMSEGAIIGFSVAGAAVIVLIGVGVVLLLRRRRRRRAKNVNGPVADTELSGVASPGASPYEA